MLLDEAADLIVRTIRDLKIQISYAGCLKTKSGSPARQGNKPPSSSVKTSEE